MTAPRGHRITRDSGATSGGSSIPTPLAPARRPPLARRGRRRRALGERQAAPRHFVALPLVAAQDPIPQIANAGLARIVRVGATPAARRSRSPAGIGGASRARGEPRVAARPETDDGEPRWRAERVIRTRRARDRDERLGPSRGLWLASCAWTRRPRRGRRNANSPRNTRESSPQTANGALERGTRACPGTMTDTSGREVLSEAGEAACSTRSSRASVPKS